MPDKLSTEELLPCPFCGGEVIDDYSNVVEYCGRGHQDASVECKACDYELTLIEDYDPDDLKFNTFQELCNRWNVRQIPKGMIYLPKITDEILDDFEDTDLIEMDSFGPNWSQIAVDFACILENTRHIPIKVKSDA